MSRYHKLPSKDSDMKELIHVDEDFKKALTALYDGLQKTNNKSIKEPDISSLDNFIQNTFSLSFPDFSFDAWHIHLIANDIDDAIKDGKYYALILPRFHLKSTITYAVILYRILKAKRSDDVIYISYKDELCCYHISNIKNIVLNNPILSHYLIDKNKQSKTSFEYEIGANRFRSFTGGVFGVKRGMHTGIGGITVSDDILSDPQNPLTFTELEKIEKVFNAEISNIPTDGSFMMVVGTVQDYSDLLFKLRDNSQYKYRFMPAYNPLLDKPEIKVLWEKGFGPEKLLKQLEKIGGKAFASEFELAPVLSTQSFFSKEELDRVIDKNLFNIQISGW